MQAYTFYYYYSDNLRLDDSDRVFLTIRESIVPNGEAHPDEPIPEEMRILGPPIIKRTHGRPPKQTYGGKYQKAQERNTRSNQPLSDMVEKAVAASELREVKKALKKAERVEQAARVKGTKAAERPLALPTTSTTARKTARTIHLDYSSMPTAAAPSPSSALVGLLSRMRLEETIYVVWMLPFS